MHPISKELLFEASGAYDFKGSVSDISPYGEGHINSTFLVTVSEIGGDAHYILQCINTDTFKEPAKLMENICGVTGFLKKRIAERGGDPDRETMEVIFTKDGRAYYTDSAGGAWRVYTFIEDTVCLQKVESPEDFCTVAETFGNFQTMLADYPAETLYETIAHFHDTPDRYRKLLASSEKDVMGRKKIVMDELSFATKRENDCRVLSDMLSKGELPLRVTHNDTKLNNVLIDKKTGKGICVIDLDTVMPGLSLNDFGDSIRFGANDCAEDEADLSKVNFSLPLFETFTKGFLSAAGKSLTKKEKEYLPWGARLMTLECGMRFLTDYLDGDTYFKISRKDHNIDRCRTQFKLVSDMERDFDKMRDIVKKYS